jgi:hypothetical protein
MAVLDEAKVINEANSVVARIQTFSNLRKLGCSLLLLLSSFVFLFLIIYRGVFEGLTISFFVLMSIGIAAMMLIQGLESWLAQSARDVFNIRFPAKLRGEERKIALDHIAGLDKKNEAIKILLRELGYTQGQLQSAPESQLNSQLQQLDSPADGIPVNSGLSSSSIPGFNSKPAPPGAAPAAPPTPASPARKAPAKPSIGKKVIPLDPFSDDT